MVTLLIFTLLVKRDTNFVGGRTEWQDTFSPPNSDGKANKTENCVSSRLPGYHDLVMKGIVCNVISNIFWSIAFQNLNFLPQTKRPRANLSVFLVRNERAKLLAVYEVISRWNIAFRSFGGHNNKKFAEIFLRHSFSGWLPFNSHFFANQVKNVGKNFISALHGNVVVFCFMTKKVDSFTA